MRFTQPLTPIIDYIPPRLTEGKEWYVSYYVRNFETGKMKRFRIKVNRIKSVKERRAAARLLMAALTERLSLGWNPILEQTAPRASTKFSEALTAFLKVKSKEMEENSLRSYRSFIKTIQEWLMVNGYRPDMYAAGFTKEMAISFMDDLEGSDGISARTYNNYLVFCRTLFNWMMEKGYIPENVFQDIKKKPKKLTQKTRRLFTDDELQRLFNWLEKENQEYLAMCLICYCCLIRPKEIALLKCKDIDLRNQVIHVREEIAKNDKSSTRTIPDCMMPFMARLNLRYPENYLFGEHPGYQFTPGTEKLSSRKMAKFWSDHVRVNCHFPPELQFYSLKDTGITNMVGTGIPITFVQQQADHSSIAMTAIYIGKQEKATEELKDIDIIHEKRK